MINTIVVLDTETTGTDPKTAALLEIAWVVLERSPADGAWRFGDSAAYYVEHAGDIPADARAVHHIHPDHVRPGAPDCLPRDTLLHNLLAAEVPGEMIYAAHNAPFDRGFLPDLGLPWLDTLRAARHLWPEAPRHTNMVLRYFLEAEPPIGLLEGLAPHRAQYDAACTAAVLLRMLERVGSAEELMELSERLVLFDKVSFGKWKGALWAEVPRDYLQWLLRKSDLVAEDPDIRHTVKYWLTK